MPSQMVSAAPQNIKVIWQRWTNLSWAVISSMKHLSRWTGEGDVESLTVLAPQRHRTLHHANALLCAMQLHFALYCAMQLQFALYCIIHSKFVKQHIIKCNALGTLCMVLQHIITRNICTPSLHCDVCKHIAHVQRIQRQFTLHYSPRCKNHHNA